MLAVKPGVFIPRPETEILVEHALAAVAGVTAPVVVDVGTGTGAIALAIKDERPDARVLAIDVSSDALALARENASGTHLAVEVAEGDLLDPVPDRLRRAVDLVVSNPPYVEEEAFATLPRDVLADPRSALAGGADTYARLFAQAFETLRPGGAVAVEIGETQAAAIRHIATGAGFVEVEVHADLTGRDRVVTARTPS